MTFIKTFYNTPRKMKITEYLWKEMQKQFDDVDDADKNNIDYVKPLDGNWYLKSNVWANNGRRYTGVHQLDASMKIISRAGMNFDDFEWLSIVSQTREINNILYGQVKAREVERLTSKNEILMYRFRYVLNGKNVLDIPDSRKYFSQSECVEAGKANPPILKNKLKKLDKLELLTDQEYCSPPDPFWHLKISVLQCLQGAILRISMEKCATCQATGLNLSEPSDHTLPGGCLDVNTNHVSLYIDDAFDEPIAAQSYTLYSHMCKILGISKPLEKIQAEACLEYTPRTRFKAILNNEFIPPYADNTQTLSSEPLKNLAREMYHNLGLQNVKNKKVRTA